MNSLERAIRDPVPRTETELERALTVAGGDPLGGGRDWDELLRSLGIEPLSSEARLDLLTTRVSQNRGAVPIEVRHALDAIVARAERGRNRLGRALDEHAYGHEDLEGLLERAATRLAHAVEEGVRKHINAVRPPITTSGIFANALASTPDYSAVVVTSACLRRGRRG